MQRSALMVAAPNVRVPQLMVPNLPSSKHYRSILGVTAMFIHASMLHIPLLENSIPCRGSRPFPLDAWVVCFFTQFSLPFA